MLEATHRFETQAGHEMGMRGHERLGFTLEEYLHRYEAVLANMAEAGVDVLLVRSPENICYLTGYETPGYYGYHCLIVTPHDEPVLIVRRIEEINASEFSWLTRTIPVDDPEHPFEFVSRELVRCGAARKRIGVEKGMARDRKCAEKRGMLYTVAEHEALSAALPDAVFVDSESIVEEARVIKSDAEVEMIRQASRIADQALLAGVEAIEVGATENDIAAAVYHAWCKHGAEYTGLPNFVLSGPRHGICHATWRGREIQPGDPIFFEIAASKYRYCGALLRCANVGEPTQRIRNLCDAARAGFEAAVDMMRPGISCEAVHQACHEVISRAGFGSTRFHRTAYSLGINFPPDWGEGHILAIQPGVTRRLEPNMTFHLQPTCISPGEVDIGFGATVRITATGCEVLTDAPMELFVI